ncbi:MULTISPECIES: aminoglycoside 3'-phosphotransferase [unclassified Brachybacterium]|uniref:aminoglycoside 3'-phosphotransferase n=1 Tax=unclassified Brachybacterium TaxID=2623841 RepID=UPI00361345D4
MSWTSEERVLLGDLADEQWREVDSGESAARVHASEGERLYAKLVPMEGIADLAAERDRTRWAGGHGIPGPRVAHWAANADGACLVTTAVPGVPADQVDRSHARQVWASVVRAARGLHATAISDCPFDRGLQHMAATAADVVSRGAVSPEFLRPEQEHVDPRDLLTALESELPAQLEREAGDLVVCHGDLCLPNVLVDPDSLEVTGFIDLGRLGLADRHADLSLLLANSGDTWPELAETFADSLEPLYGHPVDADRLRFHLQLDPLTWG